MKKLILSTLALCLLISARAEQSPQQLISAVYHSFHRVVDYSADVRMDFDIPSVRIKSLAGRVFFKQPDRFRVRTSGIVFLPKQNPYYAMNFLSDSTAYTAVATGAERIGATDCKVVTVLPLKDGDIILGKFWIDPARQRVVRTQLTTRSNGLIQMDNTYSAQAYPVPDQILFTVDMTKFKVPKAISVDINSKAAAGDYNQKGVGHITLSFSGYKINHKLPDSVFTDQTK